MNDWDFVRDFYQRVLGLSGVLVDVLADYDILKLCAEGKSNRKIAEELECDITDVSCTLAHYFNFSGFEEDLDIDTKMMYNRYKFNKYMFIQQCNTISPYVDEENFSRAYKVNKIFEKIERMVLDYATG